MGTLTHQRDHRVLWFSTFRKTPAADRPFTRLAYLSKSLELGSEKQGDERKVPTTVLGPVTSDGLDAMVRETEDMSGNTLHERLHPPAAPRDENLQPDGERLR